MISKQQEPENKKRKLRRRKPKTVPSTPKSKPQKVQFDKNVNFDYIDPASNKFYNLKDGKIKTDMSDLEIIQLANAFGTTLPLPVRRNPYKRRKITEPKKKDENLTKQPLLSSSEKRKLLLKYTKFGNLVINKIMKLQKFLIDNNIDTGKYETKYNISVLDHNSADCQIVISGKPELYQRMIAFKDKLEKFDKGVIVTTINYDTIIESGAVTIDYTILQK